MSKGYSFLSHAAGPLGRGPREKPWGCYVASEANRAKKMSKETLKAGSDAECIDGGSEPPLLGKVMRCEFDGKTTMRDFKRVRSYAVARLSRTRAGRCSR